MKRYCSILLALILMTALLAGCAKQNTDTPDAQDTPDTPPVSEQPETPPEAGGSDSGNGEIAPLDQFDITLYLPDDNAESFDEVTETVAATPQGIVDALIDHGALPEGTVVNDFQLDTNGVEVQEGDMVSYTPGDLCSITIDLSSAFSKAASSTGTAGETMLLGSLVNTLLKAYDADTVSITCDGSVLETGHNVYDEPLTFFELTSTPAE